MTIAETRTNEEDWAVKRKGSTIAAALALAFLLLGASNTSSHAGRNAASGTHPSSALTFSMKRSSALEAAGCLRNARAGVSIIRLHHSEQMTIKAHGLYPHVRYTLFVIQVPNAPFGVSIYEGDLQADADGNSTATFIGRFSAGTFAVGPGSAPAPHPHAGDAASNPAFGPVHLYHLGIWFNSPSKAHAAGCPATITPFNGVHTAGIQVLSTRQYPADTGPLSQLTP